jgi:hypothetical protein
MTEKKYDETNRGAIWKNEKKETDKHPDFTGSINVDGHDYWLSGWKRAADASPKSPSMKFVVKRKDGQPQQKPQQETPRAPGAGRHPAMDDEIPFAAEFR